MTETSILQLLERVGFPIFVALWFMLRVEKRIENLIDAVKTVTQSQEILLREITVQAALRDESERRVLDAVSGSHDGVVEHIPADNTRRRRLPTREG